ncbi:MAG: hypothetical protein ABI729_03570, partial [Chitinophagales bacterium]
MSTSNFLIYPVRLFLFVCCIFLCVSNADAYTVTKVKATLKSGQVFITWKCPAATSLKYRVYQATKPFTAKNQIKASAYLGYVRDSSSKNIRKSRFYQQNIYFAIKAGSNALAADDGLYVTTCTTTKKYYYAVIVENMLTGIADTILVSGQNTTAVAVKNKLVAPQPILQQSVPTNGDISYEYVVWGNNTTSALQPAFNNCGSYGYNFTYITHTTVTGGLMIYYRDADPFTPFVPSNCTNCNLLLLDDWLPNGENSYWYGYHENYDMYTYTNPVFSTGIVKSYTQNRVKWTLDWVINNQNIDPTRLYAHGVSHSGFGPLLTGVMFPKLLAAVWVTVTPPFIRAFPGTPREMQWGGYYDSLFTDVKDPNDGLPLMIWDLFDMRVMYRINKEVGVSYMAGVHGKNDATLGWVEYYYWYDSLEIANQGGVWYWDQRKHNGNNKNFSDSEANINYDRFYSNRSYPAFSYCSINQDWGNGTSTSGAPYGAWNGYMDWVDASITDLPDAYSIKCMIKDMYAGGVLMTQYNSCTTDLTLRRVQQFKPVQGDHIIWTVIDMNNLVLNSGSFEYDGEPITLHNITIQKTGVTVSFVNTGPLKTLNTIQAKSNPII